MLTASQGFICFPRLFICMLGIKRNDGVLLLCGSFELVLLLAIGEEDDNILHVSEAADW
jgi:hypothetical protein